MNTLTATTAPAQVAVQYPAAITHDVSLDALRLLATLMVIVIHVSATGFAQLAPHWWGVNTYESLSRASVPIFFMITGALLLPRSHNISSVLRRVWRMGFALLAWSLVYLAYNKYKVTGLILPDLPELKHWLVAIVRWPVAGHLWYLYTLMAAYFFIPVLAGFFRSSPLGLQCLVLGVWLIAASIVPFAERAFGEARAYIDTRFFYIYPGYILAGALLYHHFKMSLKGLYAGVLFYLLCSAGTAVLTWYYSRHAATNTELFYEYFAPFVVVAALSLFCVVRYLAQLLLHRYPGARQAMIFLGSLTFGIYLMHPMVIWELHHNGLPWNFTNPWLAIPTVMAVVFVVCGVITYIIRKIPVLRMIIPG